MSRMDVELRQLRVFLAVASELHFGRAARRLHISQPALSQQIRVLEKALGVALFERSSRATELTAAGRVLLEAAPRVLFEAERALSRVTQAAEGRVGLLVVGSVRTALASITPRILRSVRAGFPDLQLEVSHLDTAAQLVAIAERRIDVGLVRAAEATASVAVEPLVSEPLLAVLPSDHPLIAVTGPDDALDPTLLAEEPFVLWPRSLGASFFDALMAYCRQYGFSPHIVAEGNDIETQLGLIAAGLGVSLQPAYYANLRPPGIAFRRLSGEVPSVALQVAWRRRDRSPAVHHFIAAARECAGSPPPPIGPMAGDGPSMPSEQDRSPGHTG